jgi:predicted amidophosphoribosyltransferase
MTVNRPILISALRTAGFPNCPGCAYVRTGSPGVCASCAESELARPGSDRCVVCAQRLDATGSCPNELCRSPRRRIDRIHAIGYQTGSLRRAIYNYKFGGAREYAGVFARILLSWLEEHLAVQPPEVIVANPSFVGPGGQQFAHTEAVLAAAAEADRDHRWLFEPSAIVKTGPTLRSADAQAWSKRASANELRDMLRVADPARTAGRSVLVYDDVCTTGSQLDAVAGCLLDQGGAARVEGVVLARAPWRGAAPLNLSSPDRQADHLR